MSYSLINKDSSKKSIELGSPVVLESIDLETGCDVESDVPVVNARVADPNPSSEDIEMIKSRASSVSEGNSRGSRSSSSISASGRNRAVTFSPAAPNNSPTILTFTNISVTTKTSNKKILLDNISGSITGGFWAIMGASGGGKTTLLSTLSLRLYPC